MDEYQKTAFGLASEVPKQLITLATAIIALGATFAKDVFGPAASSARGLFYGSSAIYILSVLGGIFALMCLAGGLEKPSDPAQRGSIFKPNVVFFAGAQIVLFIVATILLVVYGARASGAPQEKAADSAKVAPTQASDSTLIIVNGQVFVQKGRVQKAPAK